MSASNWRACKIYGYRGGGFVSYAFTGPRLPVFKGGQFREPNHEIVKIDGKLSDEEAAVMRDVMNKVANGSGGKKILLQVDPVQS